MDRNYNTMRTPLIALDYSDKHKAVEKELLIDYDTGNIYIVSATDRTVIFDVTSKVLKQLESLQGDKVEVIIEGVGKVNLTKYLNSIALELRKQIKAVPIDDEVTYIIKNNVVDDHSIDVNNHYVGIKGFTEAVPGSFPIKDTHGNIQWVKLFGGDNVKPDGSFNGSIVDGYNREPSDFDDIIGPSNPDNGRVLKATDNAPYNGAVYLRASRRQITKEPYENLRVVLPKALVDQYSEIQWMLLSSKEFNPKLTFEGAIYWDNSEETQPKIDSHNLYTFRTWTGGEKWIATTQTYSNQGFHMVSSDELAKSYYSKSEIDEGFYNKAFIDDNYYTKPETDSKIKKYADSDNNWSEDL